MKDFKGKVAFITGGASGLGLGLAKVFEEAGCKVMIADVRQDHIDQAMQYFNDKGAADVRAVTLDVTDRKAFAEAADRVEEIFGKTPELLFNNAGVNSFGRVEATTYEDWDWLLGVNLYGVINGMQTFVRRMIKAGKPAHITTTASFGGFMGNPLVAPYSAAKAAVINIMESYRPSLEPYGIGVSVCCPGLIKTNIYDSALHRPEHLRNTGYLVDELTTESLKQAHEAGMDPVDLARYMKAGIEENKLYIIPYPDMPGTTKRLENHYKEILSAIPDESEVPPEVFQTTMAGMSNMANVFRNRPDMDWIKPMDRFRPASLGDKDKK